MPSQENLNKSDAQHSLWAGLLALSTLLLVRQAGWVWTSLYFQNYTVAELTTALIVVLASLNACLLLLRLILGQVISYNVTNVIIALFSLLILFDYLKQIPIISENLTDFNKILVLLLGLSVSLLTQNISPNIWKRFHLAVIVGGGIFTITPLLLANTLAAIVYWPSPSNQPATQKAPNLPVQNTIVLLLDELSANTTKPLVDQLKSSGLHVTSVSIDPAGKNTINVIPAIWTRSNFDQSVACGPTQLCSGSNVIDFSKVRASSDNIDIVGFYHRYCSIQGLRSCAFTPLPKNSAFTGLACSFPRVYNLKFMGCSNLFERNSFISIRGSILSNALKAPFWQKGGVLFVHLLAPHPLMGTPLKSLDAEYKDNIGYSSKVIKLLTEKASSSFKGEFKIIIFSDHPLRKEMWCQDRKYHNFGCKMAPSETTNQVPLIIATNFNNKSSYKNIKNNRDIFNILYM